MATKTTGMVVRSFSTGAASTPHDPLLSGTPLSTTVELKVTYPSGGGTAEVTGNIPSYSPDAPGTTTIERPEDTNGFNGSSDDFLLLSDFGWVTDSLNLASNVNLTGDPNDIINASSGGVTGLNLDSTLVSTADSTFGNYVVGGDLKIQNCGTQFAGCDVANFCRVGRLYSVGTSGLVGDASGFKITGNSWNTYNSNYRVSIKNFMQSSTLKYLVCQNNYEIYGDLSNFRTDMITINLQTSVPLGSRAGKRLYWKKVIALSAISTFDISDCGLDAQDLENALASLVAGGVTGKNAIIHGNPGAGGIDTSSGSSYDTLVNTNGWTVTTSPNASTHSGENVWNETGYWVPTEAEAQIKTTASVTQKTTIGASPINLTFAGTVPKGVYKRIRLWVVDPNQNLNILIANDPQTEFPATPPTEYVITVEHRNGVWYYVA